MITGLNKLVESADYINELDLISFKIKDGGRLDLWLNSENPLAYNLDDNRHLFLLINQSSKKNAEFLDQSLNGDIYGTPVVSDNLVKDVLLLGGIIDKSNGVYHMSNLEQKLEQSSKNRNHESRFIKNQANMLSSSPILTKKEAIEVASKALNAFNSLSNTTSYHSPSELYSHFLMTHLKDLIDSTGY